MTVTCRTKSFESVTQRVWVPFWMWQWRKQEQSKTLTVSHVKPDSTCFFQHTRTPFFFWRGLAVEGRQRSFFLNVTFVVVHFFEYHICSSWYSPIHKHPAGPETAPIKRTFFQKNGDFTTVPCWFDDWKSWKDLGRVFWLFSVIAATHAPLSAGSQHSCECISIAKL